MDAEKLKFLCKNPNSLIPSHNWNSRLDEPAHAIKLDREERERRDNPPQKNDRLKRVVVNRSPTKGNGLVLTENDRKRLRSLNLDFLDLGAYKTETKKMSYRMKSAELEQRKRIAE